MEKLLEDEILKIRCLRWGAEPIGWKRIVTVMDGGLDLFRGPMSGGQGGDGFGGREMGG